MEIPSKYDPSRVEDKWYKYWMENKFFHSEPDEREPYTMVIPPPNVTGVLHMGHMLNNTIQDILVRRARMMGKNACWLDALRPIRRYYVRVFNVGSWPTRHPNTKPRILSI